MGKYLTFNDFSDDISYGDCLLEYGLHSRLVELFQRRSEDAAAARSQDKCYNIHFNGQLAWT